MLCLNFSVVCFDAKFNFDDSARFRQKEIFAMDDQSESDPREVEAGKYDLNYIGLDGDIACLGEIYGWILAKCFFLACVMDWDSVEAHKCQYPVI